MEIENEIVQADSLRSLVPDSSIVKTMNFYWRENIKMAYIEEVPLMANR